MIIIEKYEMGAGFWFLQPKCAITSRGDAQQAAVAPTATKRSVVSGFTTLSHLI